MKQPKDLSKLLVLKLGGELLVESAQLNKVAVVIARLADQQAIVIVHGGGREIDFELTSHGIKKRTVDGLRVTDEATLPVVVGVLAGRVNTRLVAATFAAGLQAVGLTGADAAIGLVEAVPPYKTTDGNYVDLGFVGQPVGTATPHLLTELCKHGYVPIIASIGIDAEGQLFNVNADTLAAHLAVRLGASRLIMAGSTRGVLDSAGQTIAQLNLETLDQLITRQDVTDGMIAKLLACRRARQAGVAEVIVADGRDTRNIEIPIGTTIVINELQEPIG